MPSGYMASRGMAGFRMKSQACRRGCMDLDESWQPDVRLHRESIKLFAESLKIRIDKMTTET